MNNTNNYDDNEFREEELFRKFLEKYNNPEAASKAGTATLTRDETDLKPETQKKQASYKSLVSSKVKKVKNKRRNQLKEIPDEIYDSAYSNDIMLESLSDLFPDKESYFGENFKSLKLSAKIKRIFAFVTDKENSKRLACLVIPGFLILFLVLNLLAPADKISEKENRTLAQFPDISMESLTDGTFMKEYETYINDQFVFRNTFVAAKRNFEMMSGKEENHNIIIADEDYLIENTSSLSSLNVADNIKGINKLSAIPRYDVTVSVVPTAYEIYDNKLPMFAYTESYDRLTKRLKSGLKGANVADTKSTLKKYKDKYLYYRTDHHQTALGSYYLYSALGESLSYEPIPIDKFAIEKMSSDFYGTTWSTSGFADTKADIVYKYTYEKDYSCHVDFPKEKKKLNSIYNTDALKTKDKYTFYLDGNHALAEIKSSCGTDKKLAIIKDSYAHSLVPFLTNHFSEIYMIDLRYYNDDVYEYLYNKNVNDVLILYNQNTFMTDTNLTKLSALAEGSEYISVPRVNYGTVPEQEKVKDEYFDDAVFVGDSLTIGIANFSGFNSEFLCMGGLNTQTLEDKELPGGKTVMEFINSAESIGKVYIMLGTNEVAYKEPADYIKRYESFIDKVRKKFPDAIIYIESILPVTRHTSETTQIKNDQIIKYNEALLELAVRKQCYYLDCHSYFADENNCLPDNIGSDGIHLGPDKYRELSDYFRTHAVDVGGVVKIGDSKKKSFKGEGKYDTDKIANEILSSVKFKDDLSKISNSLLISNYELDTSKIQSAALYMGSGATAEEIAVFEAVNEDYAKVIETLAKDRIERKKKDFENYIPAEMTKLNSPVIVRKGNVVAVCIANKVSKSTVEKCIKQ